MDLSQLKKNQHLLLEISRDNIIILFGVLLERKESSIFSSSAIINEKNYLSLFSFSFSLFFLHSS